jgi:hypothetical protein
MHVGFGSAAAALFVAVECGELCCKWLKVVAEA